MDLLLLLFVAFSSSFGLFMVDVGQLINDNIISYLKLLRRETSFPLKLENAISWSSKPLFSAPLLTLNLLLNDLLGVKVLRSDISTLNASLGLSTVSPSEAALSLDLIFLSLLLKCLF